MGFAASWLGFLCDLIVFAGLNGRRADRWWDVSVSNQTLQVLHDSGEKEFVTSTGETSQSKPCQTERALDLAEQSFDFLAFASGDRIGLALHQHPGVIACLFIDVNIEPSLRSLRATTLLKGTGPAVEHASPVVDPRALVPTVGVVNGRPFGQT